MLHNSSTPAHKRSHIVYSIRDLDVRTVKPAPATDMKVMQSKMKNEAMKVSTFIDAIVDGGLRC